MQTSTLFARCAGSAIAAALALSATPLLAQDVGTAPLPTPAPAPATTIQPTTTAQPVLQSPVQTTTSPVTAPSPVPSNAVRVNVQDPVVQALPPEPVPSASPAPVASASPAAQASSGPAARTTTARTSAPSASSSRIDAVPAPAIAPEADASPSFDALNPPPPEVLGEAAREDAAPIATANDPAGDADSAFWMGLLLSGLAIVGLGGLAAVTLRRRRKVDAVPVLERPKVERHLVSPAVAAAEPTFVTAPLQLERTEEPAPQPARDIREWAQPQPLRRDPPSSSIREGGQELAHAGAAVALPREAPKTLEEREALLSRMVAARPDRANPFRTPKARRRRARLILQSLGRRFETGKSRIDLSQYPLNWPELAPNRPAAA